MDVDQRRSAERVATDARGHSGLTVVTTEHGDDIPCARCPLRHLDGTFVGRRAAGHLEVGAGHGARGQRNEFRAQLIDDIRLERRRDVYQAFRLFAHRFKDGGVRVAQTQVEGRRGTVYVALAVLIDEVHPLASGHPQIADRLVHGFSARARVNMHEQLPPQTNHLA